jgi:hypothetical protein
LQQSEPVAQASPACPQNDDAWHVPLLAQRPEQQSAAAAQWLPRVAHVALSEAQ